MDDIVLHMTWPVSSNSLGPSEGQTGSPITRRYGPCDEHIPSLLPYLPYPPLSCRS